MRLVRENARVCIINIKENRKLAKSNCCLTVRVEVTNRCQSLPSATKHKQMKCSRYIYTNGTRLGRVSEYIEHDHEECYTYGSRADADVHL